MSNGISRPIFPTRSSDPESQRLLASVNEFATALLNSGVVLSRLPAGDIARASSGPVNIQWNSQNRVDVGIATGIALLPGIRPEFIGRPLYLTKSSPSGTLIVRPTGNGVRLNSFSGITRQAAGLSVFLTDGEDWWSTL